MSEGGHNPCATCGACCYHYVVPLTGHDVWRICRQQRLSPEQFVVALPQLKPLKDGFRLEPGGREFGLALDKRGGFKLGRPCIFLMSLGEGHQRCGIYAGRPAACQAYPMAMWSDVVFYRPESKCPPDSWPLAEVVRPAWKEALQRLRMQLDIYGEVNRRWNARVDSAPEGRKLSLREYVSYVLNVYEELVALEAALGADEVARVEAAWPNLPRTAESLDAAAQSESGALWLGYLRQARQIVDHYYSGFQPQGDTLLTPDTTEAYGPAPAAPPVLEVAERA